MLDEYLESLEKKAKPERVPARLAKKQAKKQAQVAPKVGRSRLSEAMARAAKAHELVLIASAERAALEDRQRAEQEQHRRRQAAVALVLMMSH